MSASHLPQGLFDVADLYDAILCDVWGVIHNGRESFPAACEALARFQRDRGPVVLISNSPRPADDVVAQLRALGVPDAAYSGFVTSGDATRKELIARAPGPAWAIGPARDASLYSGTGVEFAETPHEAAFVSCTGLFDDEIETPDDFRVRLEVCAARDLVMICANPDKIVQRGDKMIYCAGALADLYVAMGGAVVMAGKPYPAIYDLARAEVDRLAAREVPKAKILAIGDGMPTDVAGANAQGLPLLFIASGIHTVDTLDASGAIDPARLAALFTREDARADYAMADLTW
ncbi:MAG: TIGR01459 family HAD-type hydrolase [Caulobacteraceae bacterium]